MLDTGASETQPPSETQVSQRKRKPRVAKAKCSKRKCEDFQVQPIPLDERPAYKEFLWLYGIPFLFAISKVPNLFKYRTGFILVCSDLDMWLCAWGWGFKSECVCVHVCVWVCVCHRIIWYMILLSANPAKVDSGQRALQAGTILVPQTGWRPQGWRKTPCLLGDWKFNEAQHWSRQLRFF